MFIEINGKNVHGTAEEILEILSKMNEGNKILPVVPSIPFVEYSFPIWDRERKYKIREHMVYNKEQEICGEIFQVCLDNRWHIWQVQDAVCEHLNPEMQEYQWRGRPEYVWLKQGYDIFLGNRTRILRDNSSKFRSAIKEYAERKNLKLLVEIQ